ncbi:MAG: beta-ketoacyl synthase N-terminal-like domain-containing protein, partial [Candidatus Hydrogenedentota bacterium]
MTASNVVITGMGIVSCIGWSPKEVYDSIRLNKRGFRPISCLESPVYRGILAGEVDGDPAARSGLARGSRSDPLAVYAARQAFDNANLSELLEDDRAEVGVVLGITTGGLSTTEVYLESLLKQGTADIELMRFHECSTSAATIAHQLELFGVQTSVSNACASGANALALARDYIQSGEAEIVLAGGVDSLTRLTVNGFNSLLVYDAQGCRPFDKDRAGMTIGEIGRAS